MPNTIPSQYMILPVPIVTVDQGPQWATDVNSCLTTIDQHDHSPGKGTPVTPAGLNINQDLSFGSTGATTNFNATNLRSTRYAVQASPLSGTNDIGCLYVTGVDLYYNDRNSNQIRISASGSIAGSPGSITGLVSPANVTYTPGNQTFTFQSSTATPANIDIGSLTIRNITANSAGITLSPPASLTTNYTITASSGPPVSSSAYVVMNSAGNLSYATPVHITPWQSYSLVIKATVTNPTYPPTVIVNNAVWRQVGDSMQINFLYLGNGGAGGANGTGVYLFPLPSSAIIDTTKMPVQVNPSGNNNFGGMPFGNCGSGWYGSDSHSGVAFVGAYNSTALVMGSVQAAVSPNSFALIGSAEGGITATSASYNLTATVPILGWS